MKLYLCGGIFDDVWCVCGGYHSFSFPCVVGSTRREGGVPAYVNLSASSMLMIAMQYTTNPGKPSYWLFGSMHANRTYIVMLCSNGSLLHFFLVYHCQLLECLMKHKQEVWKVIPL